MSVIDSSRRLHGAAIVDDAGARSLFAPLERLRRRIRAYQVIEGVATWLLVLLVAVGVQFAIDRLLRLQADMRALMLCGLLVTIGVATWRALVAPLRLRLRIADMAVLVERGEPRLGGRLVTAVEFADAVASDGAGQVERSAGMMRMVMRQACAEAASLPWQRPLNHARARRQVGVIVACLIVAALPIALAPATTRLWFRRNVLLASDAWPQRTRLAVEGLTFGRLLCARGDDVTIRASVLPGYEVPRQVFLEFRRPDGASGREQMLRVGDRFEYAFERIGESMECHVRGGDDRTDPFHIEVVDRPAITGITIRIEPPAYTRAPAYDLRQGLTVAEALRGSRLRFRITTNKPVVAAELLRGDERLADAVTRTSDTAWEGQDKPSASAVYQFALRDALGFSNLGERARPMQISVRLVADRPPKTKLDIAGVSDIVTPEAILPMHVELNDTYGLASAQLVQECTRTISAPRAAPIAGFEPGGPSFSTSFPRPLAPLGLQPTDRLSLYVEAADFDDVGGPNVGKSSIVSLRVVSREELLNELARREQQYRQEFEQLVRTEEDLYADLLTLLEAIGETAATDAQRQTFSRIERRQRQQSIRTDAVRRRFEQMLLELEVNQALGPGVQQRLARQIIEPMTNVTRVEMTEAMARLGRLARADDPAERGQLQPQFERILAAMRLILANMIKYEGFQEAITLLRDIIELQRDVNKDTERQIAEEIERLFGTEGPSATSSPMSSP